MSDCSTHAFERIDRKWVRIHESETPQSTFVEVDKHGNEVASVRNGVRFIRAKGYEESVEVREIDG